MLSWLLLGEALAKKDGSCWVPGKLPYIGLTEFEFTSQADAQEEEARRAQTEMRAAQQMGPVVYVRIGRVTIDAASGRFHTLVVTDAAGREVVRRDGDGVPDAPAGLYKHWHSSILAILPRDVPFPIHVYAVDKIVSHRCGWLVHSDGSVEPDSGPPTAAGEAPADRMLREAQQAQSPACDAGCKTACVGGTVPCGDVCIAADAACSSPPGAACTLERVCR